jgi:hypothetical protein
MLFALAVAACGGGAFESATTQASGGSTGSGGATGGSGGATGGAGGVVTGGAGGVATGGAGGVSAGGAGGVATGGAGGVATGGAGGVATGGAGGVATGGTGGVATGGAGGVVTGGAGGVATGGTGGVATGGAGGGLDGGNICTALAADVEAKLTLARRCSLALDAGLQCKKAVDGTCCPVVVGEPASAATIAYLLALKSYKDKCTYMCPLIACPIDPTGTCTLSGTGTLRIATCVQ